MPRPRHSIRSAGSSIARIILGARPAHHQHRRRQHLRQARPRTIRSPAKRSRCCGSKAPAAICARPRARISRRCTRTSCSRCNRTTPDTPNRGPKTPAEDAMVGTVPALHVQPEPARLLDRHAAARLHSAQARRSHAPERGHRRRRRSQRREADPRDLRRRHGVHALAAPGLRARPASCRRSCKQAPEGQAAS